MARKELFTDVFETDTFNEWRLKTNSIKINLQDVYDELDTLDSRFVSLTGDQTINGVKSFIQKSKWTKEYTQNEVTPMLELRVTNSNSQTAGSNHKGSGPSIDFYNPDVTASDPGVYGSANATQDTWLASRIASVSERSDSAYSDSSLIFYTSINVSPLTEKMRITSRGNVGIGTSEPSGQLSVQTTTNDSIISIQSKDNKFAAVTFGDSKSHKSGQIQYHNIGNSMRFFTGEDATGSSTERLRITSSGRVGIGITSPTEALDILGSLKSTGPIHSGEAAGGVALAAGLTPDHNANIAFNHAFGKPSINGSSARIETFVEESAGKMILQVGDNSIANATQTLEDIVELKTSSINLYVDTKINGKTNITGKLGVLDVENPDYDLCVGARSDEAGHVAIDAQGGAISLRPLKNTTHRWLLKALDNNGGRFQLTSGKWNSAKNTYDELPALTATTQGDILVRDLKVNGITQSGQVLIGDTWNSGSPEGGNKLYIKDQDSRSDYDPHGTRDSNGNYAPDKSTFPLIISDNNSDTSGPNSHGIVLYNSSGTPGSFAPSILFASRESNGTDFRSVNAGIYSRSPRGVGGFGRDQSEVATNYNDGELIFATSGLLNNSVTNSQGLTQRMVIDRSGYVGIGLSAPTETLDVEGNIKGRGDLIIHGDTKPEIEIADSNGLNAFAISHDRIAGKLIFGPKIRRGFSRRRTVNNSLSINNNGSINIRTGYLDNIDLADDKSLITKKYVDDAVGGSNIFGGLTALELNRQDEVSEGGQLTFKRATDNANYWNVDIFGNTSAPRLRISHENNNGAPATEVLSVTPFNRVGINVDDPDSDLCIGGKSTEPGSVCIDSSGGSITLRPLKNTTHAWMFDAYDGPGADAAITTSKYDPRQRRYSNSSVLRFTKDGDTFNKREFTANGSIISKSDVVAGRNLISKNDAELGTGATRWLLHTRQNSAATKGDHFTLAPRNSTDSNWNYYSGFTQTRDGSVGIGKLPDAGYKLDVNGSIQYSVGGHIQQIGRVTPTGFNGLTTHDIYSDGGTIAVGKGGSKDIYFNSDGTGFVKTRLTLGYTPSRASDAVTKSYVDARFAGLDGTNEFTGRTAFTSAGSVAGVSNSHAGSRIPTNLTGNYAHGLGFVSKFTTTSTNDGGGILIDVSDSNGDEHAISAYNINSRVNKEIFHVRALDGDIYSAGNFYNRGNIGTEGIITIGESAAGGNLSGWQIAKQQNTENLIFVYRNGSTAEQAISLGSDGRVSLHREGVADLNLVTKRYVDDKVATNTATIATNATDIATNVKNIATNATNIATNATNINAKAPTRDPVFTGRPISSNPPTSDNHLANKKYVDDKLIATGGSTGGGIGPHKLFGENHTDVATDVTPSYGDSMYYDGTEWTTGNFGNWGADMEYRGITGQSGATYSNVSYSGLSDTAKTLYARDVNGLTELFPGSPVNHSDVGTNKSGNFSGLKLTSKSPTSEFDDSGTPIFNDKDYTISGKVQFPIDGFSGTGLVNSKIRGLYISSQIFMHASATGREAEMYVTYPDGSKQPLLRTDHEKYTEGGHVYTNIEQTVFVPVNEGQTQVEIEFNLDKATGEGFEFEIIGALCTKRIELSPELDLIQITGSQAAANNNDGYVGENTGSYGAANAIWTSETPTAAPASDWSGVFPIVIPDNVSKTVIRATNSWNSHNSGHEESDHITITIDWNEETIVGNQMFVEHITGIGFLYSENLVGEKTFTQESGLFPTKTKFEIDGRSITKLPCPGHDAGVYNNPSQNYTIENYKTIASTSKRLEKGFTTVGTTGTADTDGYLIITGSSDAGGNSFYVQIGTETFRQIQNSTGGSLSGRDTITLPIAAGETWSVSDSANTTSDVIFKRKSTEISDSNSFNLIDSGATGTFTGESTYQELDLSHIVGVNKTLVVLEVFGSTVAPIFNGVATNLHFRTKGSAFINSSGDAGSGAASTSVAATGGGTVTVMTDANGKVEYKGDHDAQTGIGYRVQAYQGVIPASTTTADFTDASLTENGYQKLPNGFIMQWGRTRGKPFTNKQVQVPITFPVPFPNACLNVQSTADVGGSTAVQVAVPEIFSYDQTGMILIDGDNDTTDWDAHWTAYGH